MAGGQIVPQPHGPDAGGTDVHALQSQLVGDPLCTVGRRLQAQRQNLFFYLRRDTVWLRRFRAALLLHQGSDLGNLERAADFLEGVAMAAHDLAWPWMRCRAPRPIAAACACGSVQLRSSVVSL